MTAFNLHNSPVASPIVCAVPCAAPNGRQPLSKRFNVAVQTMANRVWPAGFLVGHNAPDDYASLLDYYRKHGRIMVDQGYSDKTSFADAEVNYAFRAWHDWTHLHYGLAFNFPHEERAVRAQIADLEKIFGKRTVNAPDHAIPEIGRSVSMRDLLWAEIYGQQSYARNHGGDFPDDQYAFTLAWLLHGAEAASVDARF